jgi:hypothetical protein
MTAELFEIKTDREVWAFGAHHENAYLAVLGYGRRGEREVSPKGATEGVSRFRAV